MFLAALMIPCARLPGSLTTHWAFAVRLTRKQPMHSIRIFFFMMFLFLIVNNSVKSQIPIFRPLDGGFRRMVGSLFRNSPSCV